MRLLALSALLLLGCGHQEQVKKIVATPSATPSPTPSPTATPVPTPVPTAVPTVKASPRPPAQSQARTDAPAAIVSAVQEVFGGDAPAALKIIACETGGTWNPHATGSAGERGLMQIHPVHKKPGGVIARAGYSWDDMYQVYPNLKVGRKLFLESGWGPWSCKRAL